MSHVMILSMLVFFGLTVPIAISIGLAAMGGVAIAGLPWLVIAQQMYAALDKFPLAAIPFFILAGNIMNKGGIAVRLINLAKLITGRAPGALAQTNVIANMLFGRLEVFTLLVLFTPTFWRE